MKMLSKMKSSMCISFIIYLIFYFNFISRSFESEISVSYDAINMNTFNDQSSIHNSSYSKNIFGFNNQHSLYQRIFTEYIRSLTSTVSCIYSLMDIYNHKNSAIRSIYFTNNYQNYHLLNHSRTLKEKNDEENDSILNTPAPNNYDSVFKFDGGIKQDYTIYTVINVRHDGPHHSEEYSTTVLVCSALLSWVLLLATSLIGLLLIPLRRKRMTRYIIIQFSNAMGFAALLSDVAFHLIPHALMSHNHSHTSSDLSSHGHSKHTVEEIKKMSMLFVGIITLYLVEIVLKIFPYTRNHKCGCHQENVLKSSESPPQETVQKHDECCGDSEQKHNCVNTDKIHDIRVTSSLHRIGTGIPPEAIIDMNQEAIGPCEGTEPTIKDNGIIINKNTKGCSSTSKVSNVMLILLLGDGAHNFFDGLAIGSLFISERSSLQEGIAATVAIIFHELPHKIGDIALLIKSGKSEIKATLLVALTSLTSLFGVIFGLILSNNVSSMTGPISLFTSGMFLYLALVLMMSQMINALSNPEFSLTLIVLCHITGMAVGVAIMILIAFMEKAH